MEQQMSLEELENLLTISYATLDHNLIQQPELYRQAADGYAYASSRRDEAKQHLEQVDSEVYSQVRADLEAQGQKPTEKLLESYVKQSGEHQEAYEKWLNAKLEADYWASLKEAFNQRAYMLRELTNLFLSGFFQEDTASPKEQQEASNNRLYEIQREKIRQARQKESTNG